MVIGVFERIYTKVRLWSAGHEYERIKPPRFWAELPRGYNDEGKIQWWCTKMGMKLFELNHWRLLRGCERTALGMGFLFYKNLMCDSCGQIPHMVTQELNRNSTDHCHFCWGPNRHYRYGLLYMMDDEGGGEFSCHDCQVILSLNKGVTGWSHMRRHPCLPQ